MRVGLNEATEYVLSIATADPSILEVIAPTLMTDPHQTWAECIIAVHAQHGSFHAGLFRTKCAERNVPPRTDWMVGGISRRIALDAFLDAYGRARVMEHMLRAKQHLDSGAPVPGLIGELVAGLNEIPVGDDTEQQILMHGWDDVLAFEGEYADWVIPGMLRHGQRTVLTGAEGHGKSTLLYQIAIAAAAGIHPLTQSDIVPQKVYVLDVENWHETQVKNHYARMEPLLRGRSPSIFLDAVRQIDLSQPFQRQSLVARLDGLRPDLVVMGSGYKLVSPQSDWRLEARFVQSAADEIRAKTGAAVMIETHAGHGEGGDRNGWRPEGSSHWLRWPESGVGLSPRDPKQAGLRLLQTKWWRGDRDPDTRWPYGWMSAKAMPWMPLDTEEEFDEMAIPEKKKGW